MKKRYNLRDKKIKEKRVEKKKGFIILLVFLGIVTIVVHSAWVNTKEVKKQLEQNLADVAQQNAHVLQSKLHAQHQLLNSLSGELQGVTQNTIKEQLSEFEIYMDSFHLKRFAYCFPDGVAYSTDGEVTDLSYREFYKQGMKGKCALSGVLSDALRAEHSQVNVMTIPIFDENENISGVFGLTYDTETFNEAMQIESFGGAGSSFALNEEGQIMMATGNDEIAVSDNLFDKLQEDEGNADSIAQLQGLIEKKSTGTGMLNLSGKNYYYCVPVELMEGDVTWYVITMIPSEILHERAHVLQINQYVTSILVAIFVCLGAVFIVAMLKAQNRKMYCLAYEDSVTGGANFEKFWLNMEDRNNGNGYLVSIGIANFSNVAIAAGMEAGDSMICKTWKIIDNSLNKGDFAAHVKDDVFLLFFADSDEKQVKERLGKLSKRISKESGVFHVFGLQMVCGVCELSENDDLELVYNKARTAREYAAMGAGFSCTFYNEVDNLKMQQEKELEERIPEALAQKEFEVWYQPKYSADDCMVVGSEALIRWREKNGELIPPGRFIPLLEKNGMIMKVDEYMFRSVCMQQKCWLEEGRKIYPVSINISRASLYYNDVVERYRKILQESGVSPEYIQLEITETVVGEKRDICDVLNEFRKLGVKILMDDFGTGASSLATLSTQCFDTLKLDKSLVDHIGDKGGEIMLCHIISMGQALGLHITAEGVEKQTQLEFLRDLKCDDIQGFYFARPMPAEEYESML